MYHRFVKKESNLRQTFSKQGKKVQVKVIGIKDGKISLSMKALSEEPEEEEEAVEIPKSEEIGTNLGDLFKNIQL